MRQRAARGLEMSSAARPTPDTSRMSSLPPAGCARFRTLVGRALTRRCPYCGGGNVFAGWFALKDRCPTCGVSFEREDGYFLGAYALNLIVAEGLGLGLALYLIFGTPIARLDLLWQEAIAVGLAVGLPVLFFPFSRTVWIALDLLVDPPGSEPERRLRGHEMGRPSVRGGSDAAGR